MVSFTRNWRKGSAGGFPVCRAVHTEVPPHICNRPVSLRLLLVELLTPNPHRPQHLKTVQRLKTQLPALNLSAAKIRTDLTSERARGLLTPGHTARRRGAPSKMACFWDACCSSLLSCSIKGLELSILQGEGSGVLLSGHGLLLLLLRRVQAALNDLL